MSFPLFALFSRILTGTLNKHNQEPPQIVGVVPSTMADELVICALGDILIQEMMYTSYLHPKCYTLFTPGKSIDEYHNAIREWRNIDMILRIDCSKAIVTFDRMKLIEKVISLVNHDDSFIRLVTSFCNLPILDSNGNDLSIKGGIPPVDFIGEVLFNIIISDIDKQVTLVSLIQLGELLSFSLKVRVSDIRSSFLPGVAP